MLEYKIVDVDRECHCLYLKYMDVEDGHDVKEYDSKNPMKAFHEFGVAPPVHYTRQIGLKPGMFENQQSKSWGSIENSVNYFKNILHVEP